MCKTNNRYANLTEYFISPMLFMKMCIVLIVLLVPGGGTVCRNQNQLPGL